MAEASESSTTKSIINGALTRARRIKAGLPSPPPVFRDGRIKPKQLANGGLPQTCTETSQCRCPVHLCTLSQAKAKRADAEKEPSSKGDDELWVQCENCLKWRRLPQCVQGSLPEEWFCHLHPDPLLQTCDTPEEEWQLPNGVIFAYRGLELGQLVWAKLDSYPPWPAIVSPDPWSNGDYFSNEDDAEGFIYHIEFLGRCRSHSWLPEEMVEPYREVCSLGRDKPFSPQEELRSNKKLQCAISEADQLVLVSNEERVVSCKYGNAWLGAKTEKQEGTDCSIPNSQKTARSKNSRTKGSTKRDRPSEAEDSASAAPQLASKRSCKNNNDAHSLISDITEKMKLLRRLSVPTASGNTSKGLLHDSQPNIESFLMSQPPTSTHFHRSTNHFPLKRSGHVPTYCGKTQSAVQSVVPSHLSMTETSNSTHTRRHLMQSTLTGSVLSQEKMKHRKTNANVQLASSNCSTGFPLHSHADLNRQCSHDPEKGSKTIKDFFQPCSTGTCSALEAASQADVADLEAEAREVLQEIENMVDVIQVQPPSDVCDQLRTRDTLGVMSVGDPGKPSDSDLDKQAKEAEEELLQIEALLRTI